MSATGKPPDGSEAAMKVAASYRYERAAPTLVWGLGLLLAAAVMAAISAEVASRSYVSSPGMDASLVLMLLAILAGIGAVVALLVGAWRAARNADYVAAVTLLRANGDRNASTPPQA